MSKEEKSYTFEDMLLFGDFMCQRGGMDAANGEPRQAGGAMNEYFQQRFGIDAYKETLRIQKKNQNANE